MVVAILLMAIVRVGTRENLWHRIHNRQHVRLVW